MSKGGRATATADDRFGRESCVSRVPTKCRGAWRSFPLEPAGYATGRGGDWLVIGFSPRAQNLTVYITSGFAKSKPLLGKLGKHSTAKSCLYLRRLADVDLVVLEKIVKHGGKPKRGRSSEAMASAR
jgi:hypothetical protein